MLAEDVPKIGKQRASNFLNEKVYREKGGMLS